MDHKNKSDNRPLDALSDHNLNFDLSLFPVRGLRVSFYGLGASKSSWFISTGATSGYVADIPAYFNLDAIVAYDLARFEVFIKVTNIFDSYMYSEPGFPWRGRFFELGAKVKIF